MMTVTELHSAYLPASTRAPVLRRAGSRITDLDLQALVDGELPESKQAELRRRVEADDLLRARYRELLEQKRLLALWWRQFS